MSIRIGNGCGFYGDQIDAPKELVSSTNLDFLTLEYLAEVTLSMLARQREKDADRGHAWEFVDVLKSLLPQLDQPKPPKIITNAGGMNPLACARDLAAELENAGMGNMVLSAVSGDDLMPYLDDWIQDGELLSHLDHHRPLIEVADRLVSANAYLGAAPLVEALRAGAQIVVTGRVADASLAVAAAQYAFDWDSTELTSLAAATVAGHLIECGAQVTGGYSTNWSQYDLTNVGYPIAEINQHGNLVITKPNGTGGAVNVHTVAEQLVYEIGDPSAYHTPDLVLDLTNVSLKQVADDRVAVEGAIGHHPTDHYKVSIAYRAGFRTSAQFVVYGPDCEQKSEAITRLILERTQQAGYSLERIHVERLGMGEAIPGLPPPNAAPMGELVLRICVSDPDPSAVERFRRELAPMATSGPAGIGGYTSVRQPVQPIYAFWPALIPKTRVDPLIKVRTQTASAWLKQDPQSLHAP